ncbi:hypothetical protein H072_10008 [Dactylellina haptotyla CBS 200.50]|uniref:Uncharacterized protein n=1 Tax=Dactylellina haptotyla (strain CBS 200.50) TaxID=1284197 RepID=S8A5R4_DACHA|nr:hypothetical protein H072_10008 [Dactylellina haptotyla CBS 200.50]
MSACVADPRTPTFGATPAMLPPSQPIPTPPTPRRKTEVNWSDLTMFVQNQQMRSGQRDTQNALIFGSSRFWDEDTESLFHNAENKKRLAKRKCANTNQQMTVAESYFSASSRQPTTPERVAERRDRETTASGAEFTR